MSNDKSAKCFLADKYQDWYSNEVLKQLTRGVKPHEAKADVRLTNIPLHANWVIQAYHYLKSSKNIIFWGFKKAHITEAEKEAHSLIKICENLSEEIDSHLIEGAFYV